MAGVTKEQVLEFIKTHIRDYCICERILDNDMTFGNDLGLDSLDVFEMKMKADELFGGDLINLDMEHSDTLETAAQKMADKSNGV